MRKLVKQLSYTWHFFLHPIDGFYELRFAKMGGYLSASIILIVFYFCNVLKLLWTNFIFNPFGLKATSPFQLLLSTFLPIVLWVLANYLVSSITKGQGTFKSIFVATAYSLMPFIVFTLPVAVISNIFTNAEVSIYHFLNLIISGWIGILFYLQVKEVHGFDVVETFINILWILFTMVAIVAFAFAFLGITIQSLDFVIEFTREAIGYV